MTDADFQEAFRRHKDVVHRFSYRMTGSSSAADDIVQDCFAALWRKPEAFDPSRGGLRAFLLGVARNLIRKRWRNDRRHESLQEDLDEESFVCPPLDVTAFERVEMVARAVLLLPPLQREVVVLAEYEDMPLEEIARATGAELAAVKSRLHRARQNLRRMLAPLLDPKGASSAAK
jgi:RNA polymerase sigma-70 factor (ECF subfamily)